ncbi:MAG: imidazoleglycerol-phosphate dehydratase HisB [Bacillota bacterium]
MKRTAKEVRRTAETAVEVEIDLDGTGRANVRTGLGFFDHMLTLFARHGLFDLKVVAEGDLEVDGHHLVEDVGIVLGRAIRQALGEGTGIARYGWALLPMDEALVQVAVDLGGRAYLAYEIDLPPAVLGGFDPGLAREFMRALAENVGCNLHIRLLAGENAHHCLEACFKGLARALRAAVAVDPRETGVPSTKGVLG